MTNPTFAPAGDAVLHVRDSSETGKPAMVFVNSLGTDLRIWDSVAAHFAPRFRTVQHDKRGHGLSSGPLDDVRIETYAGDLAALLDGRGITAAVIVGVSIGGMIAQALAAARPDLVRALVFCNTGHKIGTPEAWNDRIAAIKLKGLNGIADGVMERWFSEPYRIDHPVDLAGWRAMLTRTPEAGYAAACGAIAAADLTEGTRGIKVPTLCVAGEGDLATPPALVQELAGLIGGAGYAEIPVIGHLPSLEAPEALIGQMESHLTANGLG